MVDTVVPSLAGLLFIAVVTLEQAYRLLVAYAHHNLALLTIFARRTVGTQQVDVVLSVGDTHRAGFWLHPGEGAQRHGCLGLTEAFHHADAGLLVELLIDGGVQCLAGRAAIFE